MNYSIKDKSTENVYLRHIEQNKWNDVQAYHVENELAWRRIAILAIIALVIVSTYAMYMVNQDKHKIIVFEKDNIGNITTLGMATKSFDIDNKIIAHQLVNFITALREVPLDLSIKRRNIDLVHKMSDIKLRSAVDQLILEQYIKAHDEQIMVFVNSIKPIGSGHSWEVRWSEKTTAIANSTGVSNWSSIITFKRLDLPEPTVQIINPTGLFITYLHPTQDITHD